MDIQFDVKPKTLMRDQKVSGTIIVSYPGRYDGVVVNAQVLDSNHHVTFVSCNGLGIAGRVARLFIPRDQISTAHGATFDAIMKFEPDRKYEIKFRASIIEQHKEIESLIVFIKYTD